MRAPLVEIEGLRARPRLVDDKDRRIIDPLVEMVADIPCLGPGRGHPGEGGCLQSAFGASLRLGGRHDTDRPVPDGRGLRSGDTELYAHRRNSRSLGDSG
jgi:hypothetical protein